MISCVVEFMINESNKKVHIGLHIPYVYGLFTKEDCNIDQVQDLKIDNSIDSIEVAKNVFPEKGYELCENCWPE